MNFAIMFRAATNKDRDKIFISSVAFVLTDTGFQVDADWKVMSGNQKSRMMALEIEPQIENWPEIFNNPLEQIRVVLKFF